MMKVKFVLSCVPTLVLMLPYNRCDIIKTHVHIILRCIDPVLGNDHDTNKTTAIARQQILNKQQLNYSNRGTVGNGVFYSVRIKGLYNEDSIQARVSSKSGCEEKTERLV
jgi:hypothetical protein